MLRMMMVLAGCCWISWAVAAAAGDTDRAAGAGPLRIDAGGRGLVDGTGRPVFVLADTGWDMVERLTREEVSLYLKKRRGQGFNAVAFVCFHPVVAANVYGAEPFARREGRMDPTRPILTPGTDPQKPGQYDYWDHVDFAIGEARRNGMMIIALPCWGASAVTGSYNGKPSKEIVFDARNARVYGRWIGARYKDQPHLIWMLGGDCAGQFPQYDYREVFRAMAGGLGEGSAGSGQLLSFHPQKPNPQSSKWFHEDSWLSFNSIQAWPEDQVRCITEDWGRRPPRPTWIFEGRYEAYYKGYKPEQWGEWQCRQQAWQTVLAGAFGHTYGHERIFCFGADGWDWKKELDAPGARCMTHLAKFMNGLSAEQARTRVPDQGLIDRTNGRDEGKAERLKSDRVTAARTADKKLAVFYSANGRTVFVRMDRLAEGKGRAYYFNPRTGKWRGATGVESEGRKPFFPDERGSATGPGTPGCKFDFPGGPADGNDWVLVLEKEEE